MYKIKLTTILAIAALMCTGCNKTGSSDDIVKIVPESHTFAKEFSATRKETSLNDGIINLKAGNIQNAMEILKDFVTKNPTNAQGHFYLGRAYYENNELNKSLYHIKQAILYDQELAQELAGPIIGKGVIGRVFVTDDVNEEKNLALKPMACFDINTKNIYSSLEVINAPANTEIEAELAYEPTKTEQVRVNSILFKAEGSKNAVIAVKKPDTGWPSGKYRLNVFVNGKKNSDLTFYVF